MHPPARNDSAATILLVEDDEELRAEMAVYLLGQGYGVREAANVADARKALEAGPVGLVILDVNLPGEDGLSLCRRLAETGGPPIMMLSAMGETIDRILGLELGADDYVVKPVTPRELLARVKALLRRRPAGPEVAKRQVYTFAGFRFDPANLQLRAPSGMTLLLTRAELAILSALVERPRTPLTREELARLIKGETPEALGRAVDLHISRLRRKIHAQVAGELIKTYRGVGYLLDAEVTAE